MTTDEELVRPQASGAKNMGFAKFDSMSELHCKIPTVLVRWGLGLTRLKSGWKEMPSIQKALPPELADNVIRLYRECLRRARFIGHQKHNTGLLVSMVREQFKKNMHETDPEKIQKMKDDAARGLINHILYESEKMTGRKFSS
uniref:Complex 1 LYR protein domain-containing protein n=2 Tax=Oryza TaxID=4527 RepID=A0A0D3HVS6_9ORYZ